MRKATVCLVLVAALSMCSCAELTHLTEQGRDMFRSDAEPPKQEEGTPVGSYQLDGSLPQFVVPIPMAIVSLPAEGDKFADKFESAGPRCTVTAIEPTKFELSLDSFKSTAVEQEGPQWCWAACVEMINRVRGITLSPDSGQPHATQQGILAAHFVGADSDQGGSQSIVIRALNPDLEARLQQKGEVHLSLKYEFTTSDDIVESLLRGEPAVVGLKFGEQYHAVVVHGVTVSRQSENAFWKVVREASSRLVAYDGSQLYALHSVKIFDPAPGVGESSMPADVFKARCQMIMTPAVGRTLLYSALGLDVDGRTLPNDVRTKTYTSGDLTDKLSKH